MAGIARANASDIPRLVDMAGALCRAIGSPVLVDRDWTGRTMARLIAGADSAVWISREGFLAGSVQPTIVHPGLIGVEHGWWAMDGQGVRLLRTFEAWARGRGATLIQISTGPQGPDAARLGYRMAEQAWVRTWPSFPSSPPGPSAPG